MSSQNYYEKSSLIAEQKFSDSKKLSVNDLISRLNQEKKIEKKRNLALSIAAISAVSVFTIILTI